MGIDLADRGRRKSTRRTSLKTPNPYLKLLVDLYNFLARRTETSFNKIVAQRLLKARRFKATLSLSKLVKHMKNHDNDKIAVVVGTVTSKEKLV
jgi:large subunit ribosomal protein L18e